MAIDQFTPEEIGFDFVPRRRPGTAETRVGEQLVVANAPFEPCHVLNSTAALVWESYDGEARLSTLIEDLADALGIGTEVIAADVMEVSRQLGRLGLLEGVEPRSEMRDGGAVALAPLLGEGDLLEDFVLPDLEGRERAWSGFRGRRVLLVNWSSSCGFCLKIAYLFGELRPHLAEQGVELVFVTVGGAEDNRLLFETYALGEVAVLLKREGVDPFPGLGTPAAYLVDEDGILAAPLAFGALAVPELARRLAGVEAPEEVEDGVRYLAGGGQACAPTNGAVQSKGTHWAGLAAFELGEFHVGVRYNSEEAAALLDRLFPGAGVEDPRAQENYSVALYPAAEGVARELNLLVRSGKQVVRSRSAGRVLRGLLGHLSCDLYNPDRALVQVLGLAVVRDGEAFLLPPILDDGFSLLQPRLARRGLQIVDRPWASIDTERAQLVVAEPTVVHDKEVLEELTLDARLGSELPEVAPGRYPLRTWVLAAGSGPGGPLSQASAVGQALGLVTWIPGLQTVLDQLGELFSSVRGHALHFEGAEDFVGQLGAALG